MTKSAQTEGKSTRLYQIDSQMNNYRDNYREDQGMDDHRNQYRENSIDGQIGDDFNVIETSSVYHFDKKNLNSIEMVSAEIKSVQRDTQISLSNSPNANHVETGNLETPKMANDESSEKPDVDMITYSKLSGKY